MNICRRALKYATIRCEWEFMTLNEKMEADRGRLLCHDGFITAVNMLERLANSEGIDTGWRKKLGDERITVS